MGKVKFPGLLLALAGIFASFLLGLFVGRRTGGEILYIQQERPAVSQALSMETAPLWTMCQRRRKGGSM